MITSILLVDDEILFHVVFEDACSYKEITLALESVDSADEAEKLFKGYQDNPRAKPECVFVDLNLIGSSFDGIELINRINNTYGNGVVIGMISSSCDQMEIDKAQEVGAMFWIVKSDDIEPRLEQFKEDYFGYRDGTQGFKVYK